MESALRRAGLSDLSVAPLLSASERFGYRNKLQLPISFSGEKAVMGYYAPRSHEIIPCTDCLLQHPAMNGIAEWIREQIEQLGMTAARHLYMRCGRDSTGSESLIICLVVRYLPSGIDRLGNALRERFPQVSGFLLNLNDADTNVILGSRYIPIYGSEYVTDCLCGVDFRISPASFFQVNHDGAELAYRKIAELADLRPGDRVLDLYCGIGTIGLSVTAGLSDVSLTGIEIVPAAIKNARYNAEKAGFTQPDDPYNDSTASGSAQNENRPIRGRYARYICGDAGDAEPGQYDVIIIDPPRTGCSPELIDRLAELAAYARSLVYMSCNPQTLARDLAMLRERGITVCGELTPIDMFPCTGHVETVVLLSKGEVDSKKIRVEFSLEDMDMSEFQDGATYTQIKDYVLEHSGLKVSNLYISQIKRKCGIEVGKNYNLPKSEDSRQPQCPPEKEKAIREAFKYFGMI